MIVADENIAREIVARLRADGLEVVWIAESAPSADDVDVLSLAVGMGAVLLTDDKDFGELVVRERRPHRGVLLVRMAGVPHTTRAEMLSDLLRASLPELRDAFTVLNGEGQARIRRQPGR